MKLTDHKRNVTSICKLIIENDRRFFKCHSCCFSGYYNIYRYSQTPHVTSLRVSSFEYFPYTTDSMERNVHLQSINFFSLSPAFAIFLLYTLFQDTFSYFRTVTLFETFDVQHDIRVLIIQTLTYPESLLFLVRTKVVDS